MISWAYIAGFVDCDGWITNTRGKAWAVGLTQSSVNLEHMSLISKFFDDNDINHTLVERTSNTIIRGDKRQSQMINIMIKHQASLKVLMKKLIPHLLIKKDKAIGCLGWVEDRLDKRGVGKKVKQIQDTNKYWTDGEVERLNLLKRSGYGTRAIAFELSRSMNSISQKLHKMKGKG